MAGKKKTERTKIWLLGGEKGGMGKSMVGRVCAEQLLALKVPFHLVDADASTPNVGLTYAKELYTGFRERVAAAPTLAAGNSPSTATLDRQIVFSGDASTYLQADRILTLAEQQDVLVVLPSQVAGYVKRWLEDNDVVGMLAEPSNTIDVVHFFVSNGTNESIELFKDSVESSKGKIPHVLVLNRGAATDIDWRWFDWDGSVAKYLASYGFESIVIPELLLDPAVKTKILDGNIQFGDALKADWMPKPSVRRLNKWLKEATQALASTRYFDCHPSYPLEVEVPVEPTGEKAAA